MGRGSVLKNLKSELQSNELLRHQKRKKGDQQQHKQRKERDQQNLDAIRDAFNPFNAKFDQRKKLDTNKHMAGRPVAARSAAEEQRKRAYDAEKRLKNKVGGLVDRRFGERDKTMSDQDKMVERFAREKLNNLRNSSRKSFNIEDDAGEDDYSGVDLLTHGGQTLSFEDDFAEDDLGVDSDEDDQPSKKKMRIDQEAGIPGGEEEEKPTRPKTKAEVMQEIIAKSKMHKHERQQQREADDELVDNLNADFDELMADLTTAEQQQANQKRTVDEYDRNLQELAFEKRADPSDRTKTEEELAKQRDDEKRAAERAKTARMEGDELDIEPDGATDDANLFGLQGYSDEEDAGEFNRSDDEQNGSDDGSSNAHAVHIPETLSSLQKVLAPVENVSDKVRYFVKIATPGRGTGSKSQLHNLSVSVFQFAITQPAHFDEMARILHDVAPKHDVGVRLANEARDLVHSAKRRRSWGAKEVLLFSLIGSLFSTSDQWHVVVTSTSVVMAQRLSQSVSSDLETVCTNLFLCDLLLVYQRLSKRFIPEVVGYLLRTFSMISRETSRIAERYIRLASSSFLGNGKFPAVPKSVEGKAKLGEAASLHDTIIIATKILSKAASLWRSLDGFSEVFTPLRQCLQLVPNDGNPVVNETLDKLERLIRFSSSERKYLELQQFRPLGIVTHAPMFDENYNPEIKGASLDPEHRELQKLKALHKKERKSTLREIRRDAEFESRQNLDEKRRNMAEYHDKLRRLEGQINGEEGAERNAYEREKKRGRR